MATTPVTYSNEAPPSSSGFNYHGITATYLPSPYWTCPTCTPAPPSLIVGGKDDDQDMAENDGNRMVFTAE